MCQKLSQPPPGLATFARVTPATHQHLCPDHTSHNRPSHCLRQNHSCHCPRSDRLCLKPSTQVTHHCWSLSLNSQLGRHTHKHRQSLDIGLQLLEPLLPASTPGSLSSFVVGCCRCPRKCREESQKPLFCSGWANTHTA